MPQLIRIAKGLKASFKNAREWTVPQALLEVQKYSNNYEVLNLDHNRLYGDIDGKNMEGDEAHFTDVDQKTKQAIVNFLKDEKYALLTASSFIHKKISWRFVVLNRKASAEDNKKWVQMNIETIELPPGITFDTSPYMKNQKMRMVLSNKDDEIRPLVLVKGEPIDTLISYCEGCELMEMPRSKTRAQELKEVKEQSLREAKESTSGEQFRADQERLRMSSTYLRSIVMNIKNDTCTTWDQWYKVAQAIYNEGADEDLFLEWSALSDKHNHRDALKQWMTLKQTVADVRLSIGSLVYWSSQSNITEHENIVLQHSPKDGYTYQKIMFEKNHFKLMSPAGYVRIHEGKVSYLTTGDMFMMYANKFCANKEGEQKLFFSMWTVDTSIRTYEKVVFKPKQEVGKNEFNLFTDFPCQALEGNIDTMKDLMWLLSGEDEIVYEYLENYFAHMFQKPHEKPGVSLCFSTTKQGAGKDTPLDFIGSILGGDYFFNTEDAENNVFGRFTGHLQKTILLKMEEVEFETNKKNESALLSLITASTRSYEAKGKEPILLDDYKRIIMTTNKNVPINVPDSDRRFVLINSSEKRVGDRAYWDAVYKELAKPETKQAYYYHLLNKDISQFNIRNRPITEFYKEVRTSLRPYHATFFQNRLETNENALELNWKAIDLFTEMNAGLKYAVSGTRFGKDMKIYESCIVKKKISSNMYIANTAVLRAFLESKGWWVEL